MRINFSAAMLEYSGSMLSPISWTNFDQERQNSRQVPSPGASAASVADLTWPSLYGNPPQTELNKEAFLGQYIHRIYCRECREQEDMAAANQQSSTSSGTGSQPGSPPQYQLEQMSLAEAMNVNKQALNRRLMLRRSVNELVDAGIYPSSPLAFAGQRTLLERAKTGDILKHKIEQRPARDFLVQHHILEDSNVDPSLQSAQRRLKKAKLTDELNEKLAHRPGPLELVEQSILEADDPIKVAIKEGKLEFQKTEEGVEPTAIPKLPYEIESPKSGESSPEPSDCDNDSSASSTASTGFLPAARVPSPPDIAPLLNDTTGHTSITIGGKTLKIPITTQSFGATQLTVTVAPHQFTTIPHIHRHQPSGFGASRNNRRSAKQTRPKQQMKQRVIKFHEYKGPTASKSSNSNSNSNSGTFVTSTGPMQKLDELTPYQVSVQQQQLYLQCQLEATTSNSEVTNPTVLVPIRTQPSTPTIHQPQTPGFQQTMSQHLERQEIASPRQPSDQAVRSRPPTPSLSLRSPSVSQTNSPHNPLHVTRSLSHLEDLKVADLKHELKQRNLTVSGSKPQLIERLRTYQLQEMSAASVPSVSSTNSDFSYSTSISSVASFSDDALMAPPSVASNSSLSVSTHMNTPPPTPCSPQDEFMRSPPSVMSKHQGMEAEDSSQLTKSTAEIVREQAKQIEELQRTLCQFQQQLQMAHQPFVVPQTPPPQNMESTSEQHAQQKQVQQLTPQQVQELIQQQLGLQQQQQQSALQREHTMPIQLQTQQFQQTAQPQTSPVDITDKKVYLATPDGKMTAYKVILHTSNGLAQQMGPPRPELPTTERQESLTSQIYKEEITSNSGEPSVGENMGLDQREVAERMGLRTNDGGQRASRGIDVDDVLEVLIRTGEIDPQMMHDEQSSSNGLNISSENNLQSPQSSFSNGYLSAGPHGSTASDVTIDMNLHPPLSPLADMDWMDSSSNHYLDIDSTDRPTLDSNDNGFMCSDNLDWLADAMNLDSAQSSKSMHLFTSGSSEGTHSTSDPLLTPKPDVMSIFEMDEPDFRTNHDSSINWDKLIWQT